MSSSNPSSGRPEVPPDIPPEFVDAYLAGFQRGFAGEVGLQAVEQVEAPEPAAAEGLENLDRPADEIDRPADEIDRPADEIDPPTDEIDPPTDEIDPPTDQFQPTSDEGDERGPDNLDRSGPDRPEDMEWLFERNRDAPLGWAFNPADKDAMAGQDKSKETGAGSTSTATQASAGKSEIRTGHSPWVVLLGFLAILVVLMLVAYIGGMAFSTIVNH